MNAHGPEELLRSPARWRSVRCHVGEATLAGNSHNHMVEITVIIDGTVANCVVTAPLLVLVGREWGCQK